MAKERVVKERATLVSPKGSRVTAGVDLAARLQAKGYKAVGKAVSAEPAAQSVHEPKPTGEPKTNPVPQPAPSGTAPERPSRGASLAAWAEFAKAVKFEHAGGASRDEIRDAYEAAHPAE